MKKLLAILAFIASPAFAAVECDLIIRQLDAWGNEVPRVAAVPSGCTGAPGFVVYDIASAQPRIFPFNSTLVFSSGVVGVNPTLVSGKFDQPTGTTAQYIRGDGSLATFPASSGGTVTSVGLSSTTLNVTGSPITSSGTMSVNMPFVGTAGTYSSVTTDAQGRVTAGTAMSINDSPSRSITTSTSATGWQVSATRPARVCYEGTFSTTSTIGGPAAITVFLETADTNSTTPGDWTIKARQQNSNTITLAVALNQVDVEPWSFCRDVQAGKFVRVRSGSVTGIASAAINTEQQETTY